MIARGNQSTESGSRKLYQGVGAVKVLAVNPTKAELEKIYGRELEKEQEYLSTVDRDGKECAKVRITFIVQTVPEKNNGIEMIASHSFSLVKKCGKSVKDGVEKYKVIDKYGRTAWVTAEEAKAKAIPQYKNGPANIDSDYRPCYEQEEELTLFIKNLLNIPNVCVYTNGVWTPNPRVTPTDCEVRIENMDALFKGDVKELKEAISYQPNNLVKIVFGVRNNTENNRQYQTTYASMCLKNAATDYSKLAADIIAAKENGRLADTEFDTASLHEYVVTPTDLTPSAAAPAASEEVPW